MDAISGVSSEAGARQLSRRRCGTDALDKRLEKTVPDLRFALRTLLRTPVVTLAVVVTMALGIGATSSIFTVVHAVVLSPLPFPDSERVVMLCETNPRLEGFCVASPPNVADLARMTSSLEQAGVARTEPFIARLDGRAAGVRGGIATPGFFRTLRTRAALGRLLEPSDLDCGRNNVAVVSHAFWRDHLGADPAAVGREITVDGRGVRIVGVLPRDTYIPQFGSVELWKPLSASVDDVENRSWRGFMAIGRMAPGVDLDALDRELDVHRAALAAAYPQDNDGYGLRTVGLREHLVGPISTTLWLWLGAVTLVLLIACANVASLLLARAAGRQTEFAVRASLGASRGRLVRQLLTESLLLALAGGGLGLALASSATRALVQLAPRTIPRLDEVAIDGTVVLFSLGAAVVSAILFGLAPAREASRGTWAARLGGVRHTSRSAPRARLVIVVAELALAFMLVAGAGLLIRAFARYAAWNPGFDRAGLTESWLLVPSERYPTGDAAVSLLERAREELAGIPGVTAVGLGLAGPLFGGVETGRAAVGPAAPERDRGVTVSWFDVDAQYFDAIGRSIVRGRGFADSDRAGAQPVAVVNETLARTLFARSDPLGRTVTVDEHASQIVGVVGDLRPAQPDAATAPEIFWPIRQYPRLAAYAVMRLAPGASGIESAARARLAALDPGLQVTPFLTIDTMFDRTLAGPRFNMTLVAAFATVALALAVIGVYGVVAFAVASRTRELGVRVALGATPGRLVAGVLRHSLTLAALGLVAGLAGALALGRLLDSLLFGLPPHDPVTLAAAAAAFALVAALAGYLPARRASRIDPLEALRAE